jgi:hypothetical protein
MPGAECSARGPQVGGAGPGASPNRIDRGTYPTHDPLTMLRSIQTLLPLFSLKSKIPRLNRSSKVGAFTFNVLCIETTV